MSPKQKTIIISGILILTLIIGGIFWYISKKKSTATGPKFPVSGGFIKGPRTGGEGEGDDGPFVPGSGKPLPRLYELHKLPVAGVGFLDVPKIIQTGSNTKAAKTPSLRTIPIKEAKNTLSVRYIERGLGHIYETALMSYMQIRISNETRPGISEAQFGNNGNSVIIRSLDIKEKGTVIKTNILNLSKESNNPPFDKGSRGSDGVVPTSSPQPPTNPFLRVEELSLPDSIPFMSVAEGGSDKLFYLESSMNASSGSVTNFKNIGTTKIFGSAFTEWLPQFPGEKLITLTSRPSAAVTGHLFFVDPKTKNLTKILGGINGLTTLTSHDGKFVIYSETDGAKMRSLLYDVTKKETFLLYLKTLPEKCTWGFQKIVLLYCAVPQELPNGSYPDQWYQGLMTFSDDVWEIDPISLTMRRLFTPGEFNAPNLDIINPTVSSDGAYLIFMNKVSSTPWVYRIIDDIEPIVLKQPTATTPQTTAPIISGPVPSVPPVEMKKIK